MTRDLKYLTLGVGFLAAMLVFSMASSTGAIIIALPALAQTDGGASGGANDHRCSNAPCSGYDSPTKQKYYWRNDAA